MVGQLVFGQESIAQTIKREERENESRLTSEDMAIFDNLDAPSAGSQVADFLATASTQQSRSIRKLYSEGQAVQRPVTAFVAVTSFTLPPCLRRADVMARSLVLPFERPEGGRIKEMEQRTSDRAAVWGDLLILLQRVLERWPHAPESSELRSAAFMRFAHCVIGEKAAAALEQSLLG